MAGAPLTLAPENAGDRSVGSPSSTADSRAPDRPGPTPAVTIPAASAARRHFAEIRRTTAAQSDPPRRAPGRGCVHGIPARHPGQVGAERVVGDDGPGGADRPHRVRRLGGTTATQPAVSTCSSPSIVRAISPSTTCHTSSCSCWCSCRGAAPGRGRSGRTSYWPSAGTARSTPERRHADHVRGAVGASQATCSSARSIATSPETLRTRTSTRVSRCWGPGSWPTHATWLDHAADSRRRRAGRRPWTPTGSCPEPERTCRLPSSRTQDPHVARDVDHPGALGHLAQAHVPEVAFTSTACRRRAHLEVARHRREDRPAGDTRAAQVARGGLRLEVTADRADVKLPLADLATKSAATSSVDTSPLAVVNSPVPIAPVTRRRPTPRWPPRRCPRAARPAPRRRGGAADRMPCLFGTFTVTGAGPRGAALHGGPLDELLGPRRQRLERTVVSGPPGRDRHEAGLVVHEEPHAPRCLECLLHRTRSLQVVPYPCRRLPAWLFRFWSCSGAALERAHDERVHRDPLAPRPPPRGLEALAQAQGDASRQVAVVVALPRVARRRGGHVFDVRQVDVVAGDPDLEVAVGQLGRDLGRHVGEQLQDARRHGAAEHVRDPVGHRRHRVVAELADAQHVGTQPVDDQ